MSNQGLEINFLRDTLQQKSDVNENNRSVVPHIIWSSYDRIEAKQIASFQEYFESSSLLSNWTGDVQSLYLYPRNNQLAGNCVISACNSSEKLFSCTTNDNHLFFAIATVRIEEYFKNDDEVISLVVNRLAEFTEHKSISFQSFTSMGTEDIVFVFLGDKISDIIKTIYFLRKIEIQDRSKKKYYFCSTTYSVMGKNVCFDTTAYDFASDSAVAHVFLTLKNGVRANDFYNSLTNNVCKHCFSDDSKFIEMLIGEYDIQLAINASDSLVWNEFFSKEGALVSDSVGYKNYILCSKTVWFLTNQELQKEEYPSFVIDIDVCMDEITPETNGKMDEAINALKQRVEDINHKIDKEKKSTQTNNNIIAIYKDVILFIKELIKIMSSCMHSKWLNRLINISNSFNIGIENFFNVLVSSSKLTDIDARIFEEKVSEINGILCSLRNAISHIYKSGEHFYNVPHPSIYYSGSAHKVLMAYYNFIDMVLSLGRMKPHAKGTKQSTIAYFITFGMTNKVKTSIYFKTSTVLDNRLVGFELPYAALYDFKKYIPALLHEVYHLIAPTDRRKRNLLLLHLTLQTNLKQYIWEYLNALINSAYDKRSPNTELIIATLNNRFLELGFNDVQKECVEALQGFYAIEIGSGYVLDLDQADFIDVLKMYFGRLPEFSHLIDLVLDKINAYFSDEKNQNDITKYFDNQDLGLNYSKILPEVFSKLHMPDIVGIKAAVFSKKIVSPIDEGLFAAIKETICDAFFVDILNVEVENYLRYMLDLFAENCIEWTGTDHKELYARIGTIISYFYGNIDFGNQDEIASVKEWLAKKLAITMFTEEEKREVINLFTIYVENCQTQILILKTLLESELITSIYENILDYNQKEFFVEMIKEIKKAYDLLSEEDIERQLESILYLQSPNSVEMSANEIISIESIDYIATAQHLLQVDGISTNEDLGYFLDIISDIKKMHYDGGEIWFRGICNSSYKLIPSLYRCIPNIPNCDPPKKYVPFGYQAIMIKQAYAKTKTYHSLLEENENPLAVLHAFLQHYGIQTNFLDFSTNPLSALYWALNPDDKSDQNNLTEAVVYVFSPKCYQNAINTIQQKHNFLSLEQIGYLYPYHTHRCMSNEYVIEDMSDENILSQIRKAEEYQKLVEEDESLKYQRLPIATIVPQKNDRILAQSGCFVAYNLLSAKDPNNSESVFDYLSLEEIQKEYLRICKDGKRFLYRILIPARVQKRLNNSLHTIFDYSLAKVYPEVDKLFKQAVDELKDFFK